MIQELPIDPPERCRHDPICDLCDECDVPACSCPCFADDESLDFDELRSNPREE